MRATDINGFTRRVSINSSVGTADDDALVSFVSSLEQANYVAEHVNDEHPQQDAYVEVPHGEEEGGGETGQSYATALGGRVRIYGVGCVNVADGFELLYLRSPTFQDMADAAFVSCWEYLDVEIGFASKSFVAVQPYGQQYLYLNPAESEGTLYGILGLVAHQATHAFGLSQDVQFGKLGETALLVSRIMSELGIGQEQIHPYGYDF